MKIVGWHSQAMVRLYASSTETERAIAPTDACPRWTICRSAKVRSADVHVLRNSYDENNQHIRTLESLSAQPTSMSSLSDNLRVRMLSSYRPDWSGPMSNFLGLRAST